MTPRLEIPGRADEARVVPGAGRAVELTNLHEPFWPELGLSKGGLLRY